MSNWTKKKKWIYTLCAAVLVPSQSAGSLLLWSACYAGLNWFPSDQVTTGLQQTYTIECREPIQSRQ